MTLSQVATKFHEQNDHPFETTSTLFLDHVEILKSVGITCLIWKGIKKGVG